MRKGKTYGTILIDQKTNRTIDMIETRECEPVTEWLKSYPNLRVICRDGSITYKSAIVAAHPKAVQVSDRFHLLKNLTEYGVEYLKGKLPLNITIVTGASESPAEEVKEKQQIEFAEQINMTGCGSRSMTVEEKYEKIREHKAKGYKKCAICKRIGINVRTYDKILSMTPEERMMKSRTKAQAVHEENLRKKTELVSEIREMYRSGMLDLYSKIYNISTSDAYREICGALETGMKNRDCPTAKKK